MNAPRDKDKVTPANPEVDYERTDLEAGPSIKFLLWLAVGLFAVSGIVLVTFKQVLPRIPFFQTRPGIPAFREPPLPPGPRLEDGSTDLLDELRAEEDRILTTYGWVDAAAGVARIPIDRAMDLLAERGLPARKKAE